LTALTPAQWLFKESGSIYGSEWSVKEHHTRN